MLEGVCELATNKVIGEVLCNAPGPLGLLSMHELSTQVLRQYATMLCSAPVLCFHADKDVLSSLRAKDLLCFHDSETKIVKLPPTLNQGSL